MRTIQQMGRVKHTEGFTVAELLTVVAILAVLSAIIGVAVTNYFRDLKLAEYDNAAKSLYIAAQNNIADLQASGEWMANDGGAYTPATRTPTAERTDSGTSGGTADDGLTYYYIDAAAAQSNGILPAGTVDETVRGNSYLIEYCYETAAVYGVFYTEGSATDLETFYQRGKGTSAQDIRARDVRRGNNPLIGYYGGVDAESLQHVTLLDPQVRAGYSSTVAVTDSNLVSGPLSVKGTTATIVTFQKNVENGARVSLVLKKDAFRRLAVGYIDAQGKVRSLDTQGFCKLNSPTDDTYSLNLASMKSDAQLAGAFAEFQAGDEYRVVAKCVTSAALCRPVYGYGTGVWPSSDDVVFTSNYLADYETAADLYLYHSEAGTADVSQPFSLNLENYYNQNTFANEVLYYRIACSSGINGPTQVQSVEPSATGSQTQVLSPDSLGFYTYDQNVGSDVDASNPVYHQLDGFTVSGASRFAGGTITVSVYRADGTAVNGNPAVASEPSKTLTINVHVMASAAGWQWRVEDHGSYAEVVVTAGSSGSPNLVVSTPTSAVANWTDPHTAHRSSNGSSITVEALPAGGSTSVKFLKANPNVTLSAQNFNVTLQSGT